MIYIDTYVYTYIRICIFICICIYTHMCCSTEQCVATKDHLLAHLRRPVSEFFSASKSLSRTPAGAKKLKVTTTFVGCKRVPCIYRYIYIYIGEIDMYNI